MKFESISLLTWALNEEENIEDFFNKAILFLENLSEDYEIIFVNDGSTDSTGTKVKELSIKNPFIKYIENPKNLGVGHSMRLAIRSSTKEYVFWQTLDWSYDLSKISMLPGHHDLKEKYIYHGVRETNFTKMMLGIGKRSDNLWKGIISLVNFIVIKTLFFLPFHDVQNISFFPGNYLRGLEIWSSSSFTSPEILIRSYNNGMGFAEFPVEFIPRKFGTAKGTRIQSVMRSIFQIVQFRVIFRGSKTLRAQSRSKFKTYFS